MNNKFEGLIKSVESGLKQTGRLIDKYSPEILIGCGIVGFISTVVMVAKEAPIADALIDELHEELAESEEDLTSAKITFEEIKTVLPIYAPAIISGTVSIGCILGSYKISSKRTAAWATAYELTQASFAEYKTKVRDQIGEKKEREVVHAINQEKIDNNPPAESMLRDESKEVVMNEGSLFMLEYNGRYFRSTVEDISRAVKSISDRLSTEMFIDFNELQYELGLSSTSDGIDNGFCVEDGIDLDRFDYVTAPNGEVCGVVDFLVRPKPRKY